MRDTNELNIQFPIRTERNNNATADWCKLGL